MFDLKNVIQTWKRNLRSNPAFEDGDIAELESHLQDEIERLKAEGFSKEESFNKATEEIGEPAPIGEGLFNHQHNLNNHKMGKDLESLTNLS